jgi:hypothetical protein
VFLGNALFGIAHEPSPPERMVWELLDGEHLVQDIAAEIADAFHLARSQSLAAVTIFTDKLLLMGCLEVLQMSESLPRAA